MKKKVLVTGGTGFLGAALVKRLVRDGYRVRVLDNNSRGNSRRLRDVMDRIEFVKTDIRDAAAVARAVRGVDSVCHLAFVNGTEFFYSKPELVLEVGVKGMLNVIDACLRHRVHDLVVASSSEVYQTPPRIPTDETAPLVVPDPLNPRYSYGAGKLISEVLALNYGRKMIRRVVVFRPHNVYGPDMGNEHVLPQFVMRFKQLAARHRGVVPMKIQGSGLETRSFVYIDDFTDGLMRVFEKGRHRNIYHIGSAEEVSIRDAARLVARYFGRRIRIIPGRRLAGSTPRRCPDISKLKALGFKPKTMLKDGLPLLASWYDNSHV